MFYNTAAINRTQELLKSTTCWSRFLPWSRPSGHLTITTIKCVIPETIREVRSHGEYLTAINEKSNPNVARSKILLVEKTIDTSKLFGFISMQTHLESAQYNTCMRCHAYTTFILVYDCRETIMHTCAAE